MIRLSKANLEAIRQHGAQDYPRECVGVLLGKLEGDKRIVEEVRPLPNTFDPSWEAQVREEKGVQPQAAAIPGQERRYLVAPDTMFRLMREERATGVKVIGFYHSHPDHPARPSVYDRDWASPWYIYCILSVQHGQPKEFTAWQLNEAGDAFVEEKIEVFD